MRCQMCDGPIRATAGHEVYDEASQTVRVWHKKCWAPNVKALKLAEKAISNGSARSGA